MSQCRVITRFALSAAIGFCSLASEAHAAVIRYEFSGYVQPIVLPLPPGSPGYSFTTLSTFEGYIQYDQDEAALLGGDETQAFWDFASGSETYLTNGTETFSSTQAIQMAVYTYNDLWDILSGIEHEPPLEPAQWQFWLTFDGSDAFSPPASIPGANLTLADFMYHSSTLYVAGAQGYSNPWAIPLRLTAFEGQVVPEPAQPLTALGLLAIAGAIRARTHRA